MRNTQWFKGKKVLVIGLAKSGMAAARLLNELEASVTVNEAKDMSGTKEAKELEEKGIDVVSGSHPLHIMDEGIEYVVKNPGIRYDTPIIRRALEKGLPIVTEIELAGMVCGGSIAAVTGSNGKTTTTTLIHEMLLKSSVSSYAAGNIGRVACETAPLVQPGEVMVTEVSSFQLKGTAEFHPRTAVLLNIVDAHLDYHGTRDDYQQSKAKIFANLTASDATVYNAEDPVVSAIAEQSNADLVPFSVNGWTTKGAFIQNGWYWFRDTPILSADEASLPGRHNQENMLAAIACAMLNGAEPDAVRTVLRHFQGVEHRLQFVGRVHKRDVYNDSKSTNILSAQKAVAAFEAPVVLLAGGLDRGNSFDALIPSLQKTKAAVFYGESREKLAEAAKKAGMESWHFADTLEEAVEKGFLLTDEKDVFLLSPACASWDQFQTFEERGDTFIQAVQSLDAPR
ncbi:UDP-N-acetylmuramoyl-L-alanine--D-glutamate ligase [Salibacterium halotolerans]|uniref:UDP-N-acetylmuramoylalanine--D-glutamate ligase n=1 Tax=Salibacterium halotolerans TaxID=1884432 RepID=A0A1I5M4U7_9BACI|nr:UDP-N-acetylmuramoyl-L-alanine--D-glutamate ligase [Salibacterium halotolerans]SFP04530.1 UDP-N-acetylmuramoylalanine--D-glutamate ligase [Salibacterium halotolerans]